MIYIFGGAFDPPHVGHAAIVKSILAKKNPEKIVIIPSSERDDKQYHISDTDRLALLHIFVEELDDKRVTIDDFFIKNWKGEMITRDVDRYAREQYGEDRSHIFGTDVISSMSDWDNEHYAAERVKKLFIPRPFPDYPDDNVDRWRSVAEEQGIKNFDILTDTHIPAISSTEIRTSIPGYTELKTLYSYTPQYIIPGLSRRISQYILEHRLYRPTLSKKPTVLVHVCCGPDVTMPILQLRDGYNILCFWYDPNIQPKEEYDKRYKAFVEICELENIPYIKGAYDVKNFFTRIRGLEFTPEKGEKCTHCYDMRMYAAAKLAHRLHIPYYTSSLNTSPKKDLEKLFKIGHEYASRFKIAFLDIPFRKRGGFEHSVEYTKKNNIYRQNYCGCIYSIAGGGESEQKRKIVG